MLNLEKSFPFSSRIIRDTLPVRIVGPPMFDDCLNYLNFNSVSDEIFILKKF